MPRRRTILGGLLAGAGGLAAVTVAEPALAGGAAGAPHPPGAAVATSPDGHATIAVWADRSGAHWAATYHGVTVAGTSALGLVLADGTVLGPHATAGPAATSNHHGSWRPAYGRNATVDDSWTQVRLPLTDNGIGFAVVARAYDGGVALRYEVTTAPGGSVELSGEATTVVLPAGSVVYGSRDEDQFLATSPAHIPSSGSATTDTGPLFDNPVTAVLPGGTLVCVCEADRQHYPRLMLSGGNGNALGTHLMRFAGRGGTDGPVDTCTVPVGSSTPWRVLVAGTDGPDLIDHADLAPTLAPPTAIGDTGWIRPGKALRVTSLNTQAALDGIDFAVARNLAYIEFDAGWYGPEHDPTSDPTKPIAALDMPQIIGYGQTNGVGLVLYVNSIALSDPDSLFALYQSWGVAGLKLGFVLEGTQAQTDQVIGFATTAAKYHLLVNQHDDLRPFGQDRTWPNWINLEGVRGNEHFPTAGHNVTLPFTRNIAGPMDYTICLSYNRDQTTDAHQMAMAAVFYQPIVWLYWYDAPAKYATGNWPQLPWFDAVPSVWDESRALAGEIGQYAVVARRSGDSWFLGAMTSEQGRVLDVPLGFLGAGSWQATVWADGTPNDSSPYLTPVTVSTSTVTAGTTLSMKLAPSGGQAVLLTPA
jgi:alpha-glucosidase